MLVARLRKYLLKSLAFGRLTINPAPIKFRTDAQSAFNFDTLSLYRFETETELFATPSGEFHATSFRRLAAEFVKFNKKSKHGTKNATHGPTVRRPTRRVTDEKGIHRESLIRILQLERPPRKEY